MTETLQTELHEQLCAFGQAFRHAYEQAGLSKRAVSAAVPLDRSAIGKIERGLRGPHFETLLRLARAARSTPAQLLGEDGAVAGAGVVAGTRKAVGLRTTAGAEATATGGYDEHASVAAAARRLGENLRRARQDNGEDMTQEELAFRAELDRSSMSGYETGRVAPSLPTILKLARTLEVRPAALLQGVALASEAG